MISSEVQRTLVKSPPELWAEISDPESLARHLGEFGDIRITRVEPEQRVDWQSGDASGSVVIKPSGWGTKVKLTVTRELAEPPATPADEVEAPAALQPTPEPEPEPEPEPLEPAAEAEGELEADLEPEPTALAEDQPEYEDEEYEDEGFELEGDDAPDALVQDDFADDFAEQQPAPQPRRGFFARLFGRRRRAPEPEHTEL
ncbi:MAG TPA: hypothetical protein VH025_07545, partial [Solirubrobacteraceae bacterium]|nr:hypothetical protein [Solirubrobacteraceae bacterium]